MSKKITSMIALVLLLAVTCVPTQAIAAVGTVESQSIPASGTLVLTSVLTVSGGPLTFDADHTDLSVTAPETITVNFDGAQAAFQSIVVSCDNPSYTGTGAGDGMVGQQDTTVSVPLFWTVFDNLSSAEDYVFEEDAGSIDPTYQPYLINEAPVTMSDGGDADGDGTVSAAEANDNQLSYASAIWDVKATSAKLADFPYNANGDHAADNPRTVDSGTAYLRFAADYNGATGQSYATTVNIDLITIS